MFAYGITVDCGGYAEQDKLSFVQAMSTRVFGLSATPNFADFRGLQDTLTDSRTTLTNCDGNVTKELQLSSTFVPTISASASKRVQINRTVGCHRRRRVLQDHVLLCALDVPTASDVRVFHNRHLSPRETF